jgi:hypothetical protein
MGGSRREDASFGLSERWRRPGSGLSMQRTCIASVLSLALSPVRRCLFVAKRPAPLMRPFRAKFPCVVIVARVSGA